MGASAPGLRSRETFRAKVRNVVGGYGPLLRWYRRVRPKWAWERFNEDGRITRRYVSQHGLTVRHGPFTGMTYPASAIGTVNHLPSKLLGTYEQDLGKVFDLPFDLFAEIGSGEGYFCVGAARRQPGATIIGWETDTREQRFCHDLAAVNRVRVETRGTAAPEDIDALPAGNLLLMVDIEGGEFEFVDPARATRLLTASMVVEMHWWQETIESVLRERFAKSHHIEIIDQQPWDLATLPELAGWSEHDAATAVSEGRSRFARWMILTPLA